MSRRSWPSTRTTRPDAQEVQDIRGFTLIEVVGALVIFSMGVLMVLQVSGALGGRMRYAGERSQIVVLANEKLDSLAAEAFGSLAAGTTQSNFTIDGQSFKRSVTITTMTPVLKRIDVSIVPNPGSRGPSHSVTTYASAVW